MAKKIKVGFLSRYSGTVDRGVEAYVYELSKRLVDFDVEVLSGSDSDNLRLILKKKFDVVIATNGRLQALKASLGRLIGGHKLIISGQAGIGRDDMWNLVVCVPDVYVGLTDYETNWAKKFAWMSKLVKIPNGVDLKKFTPEGRKIDIELPRPIILSAAALEWYKHHERAIEAVSRLEKGSLLILGKGSKQDELNSLGNKKLPGRFKITSVKFEEIPDYYRSADIFTLPSWIRESFGIVYVEAMASGLPVVAPNDPPRREIVNSGGILVDVTDPEKYEKALQEALDKKWGDAPRKQAEKFSWDNIAKQYEALIRELLG